MRVFIAEGTTAERELIMTKNKPGDRRISKKGDNPDNLNLGTTDGFGVFSIDQAQKATFHLQAITLLNSWTYNLSILDFSGIKERDLSRKSNDFFR